MKMKFIITAEHEIPPETDLDDCYGGAKTLEEVCNYLLKLIQEGGIGVEDLLSWSEVISIDVKPSETS